MADRRDAIIKSFDVAVDKPMVPAFVCACVSGISRVNLPQDNDSVRKRNLGNRCQSSVACQCSRVPSKNTMQ